MAQLPPAEMMSAMDSNVKNGFGTITRNGNTYTYTSGSKSTTPGQSTSWTMPAGYSNPSYPDTASQNQQQQQQQPQQQKYEYNGVLYDTMAQAQAAANQAAFNQGYSDTLQKANQNNWSWFYVDVGGNRKYYYKNENNSWVQTSSENSAKESAQLAVVKNYVKQNPNVQIISNTMDGVTKYFANVNGTVTPKASQAEAQSFYTSEIAKLNQTQQTQQSTGNQIPFSGTLSEGKVVTDNQGKYFKYTNGKWYSITQAQYEAGSNKTIIAPQEGNWIQAQTNFGGQLQAQQQQQPQESTPQQPATTQYSTEFENYWKNLNPTFEKSEANKQAMWDQWNTMGAPEGYQATTDDPLPTGTGPLPMSEGEKEAMIKKYTDAGYTKAQAETAVNNLTSTRKPYETGNAIIDAILNQITPDQLAVADFKWNDTLQAEAKAMAEKDFGPYYTRMYESEEASLKSGLEGYQRTYERDVEDTGLAKQKLQKEYTEALQSARRSYASSGLTYSSERSGKESQLTGSLTEGLTAQDTSLARTKEDVEKAQQELMQKGELRLGSTAADKLKSQYNYTSPLSERYSGELELEKKKAIAEDIQRQKSNYLQIYT